MQGLELNKMAANAASKVVEAFESVGRTFPVPLPQNPFNREPSDRPDHRDADGRIYPPAWQDNPGDTESTNAWGFADTQFEINDHGNVVLTGDRYPLSGVELDRLLPWASENLDFDISASNSVPAPLPAEIPEATKNGRFILEVDGFLAPDQFTDDPELRLRHGHGHTVSEVFAVNNGGLKRIPDAVVFPREEFEVEQLVAAAVRHDVVLIPFGGGTCVTEALECPENESRMIVSVDMRQMNRIEWIDPGNNRARIQAGAIGRHLVDQLAEYGLTMGHEPDSVEFSTLGGWIATNASGMKKNKYGNIEDLVLDITVVTPAGKLERKTVVPRESIGSDPRQWMFGSEGNLGIITSAVVKVFPLPEVQNYGSVIFPDFDTGFKFMRDLGEAGVLPASVRLVDNTQFQFALALKPSSTGLAAIKSEVEKLFVTRLKGFDPSKMVVCTLVFEGERHEVALQEARVYRIAAQHGGMRAGEDNGKRGYQLTFSIAYIRDFMMKHSILGESFETSVSWTDAVTMCANVKERVQLEHAKRNLPGKPFITCRVTQIYETGVCVYFYLGFVHKDVEKPAQVFAEIETAARQEILASGGSLSHHHGVGKLRQEFLGDVLAPLELDWLSQTKQLLDPQNVFACGNLAQVDSKPMSHLEAAPLAHEESA